MRKNIALAAAGLAVIGLTACTIGTPKPAPTVTRTVAPPTTAPPAPIVIMTASQLDKAILTGGDWISTDGTISYKVSDVQCEPNSVSATGVGRYQCDLTETVDKSTNGEATVGASGRDSKEIIVGPDGSYVSSNN